MKPVEYRQQRREKKPLIQKIKLNYFFLIHIILLIFINRSHFDIEKLHDILK